jgi:hypothetical protein
VTRQCCLRKEDIYKKMVATGRLELPTPAL